MKSSSRRHYIDDNQQMMQKSKQSGFLFLDEWGTQACRNPASMNMDMATSDLTRMALLDLPIMKNYSVFESVRREGHFLGSARNTYY
eukprot:scaffold8090_cov82-Cylindrotheca_fusiformis.AAC.7